VEGGGFSDGDGDLSASMTSSMSMVKAAVEDSQPILKDMLVWKPQCNIEGLEVKKIGIICVHCTLLEKLDV
jgi:hypothetical protein